MNSWSRRRKRIILSILIFIVVVLIGVPMFLLFYRAPTCFDVRQNGDEAGVDCGGSCQLLCTSDSLPLILKGDPRVLTLATSTYQVVALVENSNSTAEIPRAGYIIKVYDASSAVPVKVFEGEVYVPRGDTSVVFDGPFVLEAGVVPVRATLGWKEPTIVWNQNSLSSPELRVVEPVFSRLETSPRLEATVENPTLGSVSNIDLTVLVSDTSGNIFAASRTFVDELRPGERNKVIFTWPRSFEQEPVGIEILIRVLPDRSYIR
ncbi:hypothetical protein A2933_00580 [Candidatus Nomurabacteria bacterium RIFCSPLOWO2_01_FULL_46_18]|uniref:Uncharacterized protein n=1 Tax=Candidatus Nomurabacteria bacterium RIFCSPLOWO2_01_FULL_46_18 TaxID=1801783 RepID=A0A1F6XF45_9BACT|nr:MAG: hypothetical protein A2933_00580 [Candidatus Nomurabacteria bacterium RIFCSPLOWO2_01_FULL_46_18]